VSGREALQGAHRAATAALIARLERVFARLDAAFQAAPDELARRPAPDAWSAGEVLEHVALTTGFLSILLEKIARRARALVAAGAEWPTRAPDVERLEALARGSGGWPAPEHMLPRGTLDPPAARARLAALGRACRLLLEELPAGEGTLKRVRMSRVEGDDRLDLLQYATVLVLHAERHLAQLARNRARLRAARGGGQDER
jgi:hypothetical protein